MLATGGLTPGDLKTVMVPNVVRGVDELIAGRVDVTVFAIGGAKVAEADAALGGIRFLPLDNSPAARAALKQGVADRLCRHGQAGAQPRRREGADAPCSTTMRCSLTRTCRPSA